MAIKQKSALEETLQLVRDKTSRAVSNVKKSSFGTGTKAYNSFKNFYKDFKQDYNTFKTNSSEQEKKFKTEFKDAPFYTAPRIPIRQVKPPQQGPNPFLKTIANIETSANKTATSFNKRIKPGLIRAKGTTQVGMGLLKDTINKFDKNSPISPTGDLTEKFLTPESKIKKSDILEQREIGTQKSLQAGMETIKQAENQLEQINKEDPIEDKGFMENIKNPQWIAAGLAMNAPSLLSSLGIGAATTIATGGNAVAGLVGAFAPSYLMNSGDAYAQAKEYGAEEELARNTGNLVGVINGSLDALGIGKILDSIGGDQVKGLAVKEIIKNVLKNGALEGTTESIQEIVQNTVAKFYYDNKRNLFQGVPEASFFGMLMGGGSSAVVDTIGAGVEGYNNLPPEVKEGGYVGSTESEAKNVLDKQADIIEKTIIETDSVIPEVQQLKNLIKEYKKDPTDFIKKFKLAPTEEKVEAPIPTETPNPKDITDVQAAIEYINNASTDEEIMSGEYAAASNAIRNFTKSYIDPSIDTTFDLPDAINKIETKLAEINQPGSSILEDQDTTQETQSEYQTLNEGGQPMIPMGNATWKTAEVDMPVVVTGHLGVGPDNRYYVSVEGSDTGVPVDELVFPEGTKQSEFISSVKENPNINVENRTAVQGIYDMTTDEGRIKYGEEYVKKDEMGAYNRLLSDEPLSNELQGIAYALHKQLQEKATEAKKTQNTEQYDAYKKQITEVINALAKRAPEAGQVVQFFHLWSYSTPEDVVSWAEDIYKEANEIKNLNVGRMGTMLTEIFSKKKSWKMELSKEKKVMIKERMEEINTIVDKKERALAMQQLKEEIVEDIPVPIRVIIDAYRYQNVLSGLRTQLRNILGNTWNTAIVKPIELLDMATWDLVKSTLTGKQRERFFSEVPIYYRALIGSLQEGFNNFQSKWNDPNIQLGKGDSPIDGEYMSFNSMMQEKVPNYLKLVGRLLEGEDVFYQTLLSNAEQARLLSLGTDPETAAMEGEKLAREYLYRSELDPTGKGGQGVIGQKIDALTNWIMKARDMLPAPLNWPIMFLRVPFAIAKMSMEFNPITGSLMAIGAKDKSRYYSRARIGGAIMAIGALYALNGDMTWEAPEDEKERQAWYDTGRKPRSFAVNTPMGKKWVPITYLGPWGWTFSLPAAVNYYFKDGPNALSDSQLEKIKDLVLASITTWSETTPLTSVAAVFKTLAGDVDFTTPKTAGYTASQLVPLRGLLADIAHTIDPTYRKAKGFIDTIQKDLPLISKEVEPILTSTGEEAKRPTFELLQPYTIGDAAPEFEDTFQQLKETNQESKLANQLAKDSEKENEELLKTLGVSTDIVNTSQEAINKKNEKNITTLLDTYDTAQSDEVKERIATVLAEKFNTTIDEARKDKLMKDIEQDQKGLSTVSKEKLARSNEFKYAEKLLEEYGELDPAFAQKEIEKLGISQDDLIYDKKTALADDLQYDEIISGIDGLSEDEMIETLISYRKVSEGSRKALLTDTLIGKLEKNGTISEALADFLKNLEWDSKTGEFKQIASGGSGKKKDLSISVPKGAQYKGGGGINIKPIKISAGSVKTGAGGKSGSSSVYKTLLSKVPKIKSTTTLKTKPISKVSTRLRNPVSRIGQLGKI